VDRGGEVACATSGANSGPRIAKKARISRTYVNNLEAGKYDPTVGVAKRIAKALGVPVTELLE
jgi:transcriptional regulator with XRE-family HTH domain